MTKNILITSLQSGIGKTTFTLALARKLHNMNIKVGYFKPISDQSEDIDSINAKAVLNMPEAIEDICPVFISPYEYDMSKDKIQEFRKKILSSYDKLKTQYEFLIIETNRTLQNLAFLGFSGIDLAKILDAKILMIASGKHIDDVDSFILISEFAKSKDIEVIGGILSIVPLEYNELYKKSICPELKEQHQIEVFGLLPDRSELVAPNVEEINELIHAKIIAGEKYMDNLVEHYMIGAMEPETALKYFRRNGNKAVITGGDRPQLAIAALETDTSVLILTGGINPPSSVIAKAEEKHVPILLVPNDTFSTTKMLTETPIYGSLKTDQKAKLDAWDKIISEIDCERIYGKLK